MRKTVSTCLILASFFARNNFASNVIQKERKTTKPVTKAVSKKSTAKQADKLEVGKKIPELLENSKELALVKNGAAWTHKNLDKKLALLFYVAPSESDLNRHVTKAIKSAKLDRTYYSSYAIINMAASRWPNWALSMKLDSSQKEFANTTYVKDYSKNLVKKWGLKDDSNDIVLMENGKVLFVHRGKLPKEKTEQLLELLKKKISEASQTKISKKTTKKKVSKA